MIVLLQLVSTALWVTSSGLSVQRKIRNRANALANNFSSKVTSVNNKFEKDTGISMSGANKAKGSLDKVRNVGNKALKVVNKTSVTVIRTVRTVVNLIKHAFMALFPFVLALDITIFVIVVVTASSVVPLLQLADGLGLSSGGYTISTGGAAQGAIGGSGTTGISGSSNKIIYVGDSRAYGMGLSVGGLSDTDSNTIIGPWGDDYLVAKGSMGFAWMTADAQVSVIEAQITEGSTVVIAMGVNGCGPNTGETTAAFAERYSNQYATWINNKAKEWKEKGAETVFVSVNPVNETVEAEYGYTVKNEHIEAFNAKMKQKLKDAGYIDTYSVIKSDVDAGKTGTFDGLHYTTEVYTKLKNYIWSAVKGG